MNIDEFEVLFKDESIANINFYFLTIIIKHILFFISFSFVIVSLSIACFLNEVYFLFGFAFVLMQLLLCGALVYRVNKDIHNLKKSLNPTIIKLILVPFLKFYFYPSLNKKLDSGFREGDSFISFLIFHSKSISLNECINHSYHNGSFFSVFFVLYYLSINKNNFSKTELNYIINNHTKIKTISIFNAENWNNSEKLLLTFTNIKKQIVSENISLFT